jgi:hypothetical protein
MTAAANVTATSPITQIKQEWQQSQRLRIGVYVVLAIVWVYGILVLRDSVKTEREGWQTAESRNTRARQTATSADWLTRQQDVAASMNEFEQLLWREGSLGLSQAAFQERITQGFASANVTVRSLRVATAADTPVSADLADIVPLRARAQVEFRPSTFYPWLAALASTRTDKRATIMVDTLTIRAGSLGQPSLADIELVGYVLKGAAPVSPASPAAASTSPTTSNPPVLPAPVPTFEQPRPKPATAPQSPQPPELPLPKPS